MLGPFQSVSEKIKGGYLFKEHIEKAINLRPSESTLYHLLGRWSFEVSHAKTAVSNIYFLIFEYRIAFTCSLPSHEISNWKCKLHKNIIIPSTTISAERVDTAGVSDWKSSVWPDNRTGLIKAGYRSDRTLSSTYKWWKTVFRIGQSVWRKAK